MHTVHSKMEAQDSPAINLTHALAGSLSNFTGKSSPFSTIMVAIPRPLTVAIKNCSIILKIYPKRI